MRNSKFEVRNSKSGGGISHFAFRIPHLLFVVPGDIQRQTGGSLYDRKLVESLTERGFRVEIATVPDLPYFAGLIAGAIISPLLVLRLARRKYDVVLVDGWAHPTTLLFNTACWLYGKAPVVIVVHQIRWREMNPFARFICRLAEQLLLRSAQLIVTVSDFIRGEVERLVGSSERIVVAPPGSTAFTNMSREQVETEVAPLRLLFVGNCVHLKGLEHLISAMALIKDLPLRLEVVGDVTSEPRYYKKLLRQVKALGVNDRVTFHGSISHDDLGAFYSRADIFTFPSLYEGFGIVLAEAMHAGLPIVATCTGPASEILREGENALIVPVADSAALAVAIRRLATDARMREDFGRHSRELAAMLSNWGETCDDVCTQIEVICRMTPGTKQSMKRTPTQSP
jgi:glycosyltransferase involved in cell wall biosynthesis